MPDAPTNHLTPQLGDRVRDRLSGFTGIIHAQTVFLNGCRRVGVTPPVAADGGFRDVQWFDLEQLDVIEPGVERAHPSILSPRDMALATGGPRPDFRQNRNGDPADPGTAPIGRLA